MNSQPMPWTRPRNLENQTKTVPQHRPFRWLVLLLSAGLASVLVGCQREVSQESAEFAYVSGANVEFRNELGPSSEVVGHLQTGTRVQIVSRRPRWAEVRLDNGETGWILQRFLVAQRIYDQFVKLAQQTATLPSQGRAVIRRPANLHLEPGRNAQVFYQLAEDEQAEVVEHRVAPRNPIPRNADSEASTPEGQPELSATDNEDWLLVRAAGGRAGWLLEASTEMNPPIEVAQYREGLRIRAWFEIYRELDKGEEHSWYLWATVRRLAGLPNDFDEIRVFTWNPRASRYETAYRERNLIGFYPVVVNSRESSGGASPAFRLQLEDSKGQRFEKSYFMVGRQVRVER